MFSTVPFGSFRIYQWEDNNVMSQMSSNSWKEIAETIGMDVRGCEVEKPEGQVFDTNKERGSRRGKGYIGWQSI